MAKIIVLLAAAYVGGQLKQPTDGPLSATDQEAETLIEAGMAQDATAEFPNGLQPDAEPAAAADGEAAPKKQSGRSKAADHATAQE